MTSIDASQRLAALLRSQVSAFRERPATRGQASAAPGLTSATAQQDVAAIVAQRIGAIPARDPDRKHKAVRIFLESVLLHEFGARLLNDAAFPEMVDAVQAQIQADAQLAAAADELGQVLTLRR